MNDYTILHGDAMTMLRTLPDASVHCCVTSPPYWGLRDYGTDGQIGLEKSPGEYVARMVDVFREVRRVLRDDGTLWLNLGDSYAGSGGAHAKNHANPGLSKSWDRNGVPHWGALGQPGNYLPPVGLKPKDLCGIPWRVAFALQDDGWWLRAEIIWAKRAPMPESVTDRPTRSHEQIFLITKSARYYYDQEAVREPLLESSIQRISQSTFDTQTGGNKDYGSKGVSVNRSARRTLENLKEAYSKQVVWEDRQNGWAERDKSIGRNQRDVWLLGPEPYPEAHFATFPTEIPRRAILAGTSERGCCPNCGAPWKRLVQRTDEPDVSAKGSRFDAGKTVRRDGGDHTQPGERMTKQTTGWTPTCTCSSVYPLPNPLPCTVLDPFLGSGTTLAVAVGLGRHGIGIELNADYTELAERRIVETQRPLRLTEVS